MGILDKIFGGGEQKQTTEIDPKLKEALYDNLARAQAFSRIGYQPYYGPSVAAMTPSQTSAMANTSSLASALGMQAPQSQNLGMPAPRDYGNGMMAYSSGDLFDQSLAELQKRRPAQYQAMQDMFINPQTGSMTGYDQSNTVSAMVQAGIPADIAARAAGGDSEAIQALGGYGFNREKLAAFLAGIPSVGLGTGLLSILGKSLQEGYQKEMEAITGSTGGQLAGWGSDGTSSNASRQSDALSSAGESWGSPNVGAGGGNVSRGFSTGGW